MLPMQDMNGNLVHSGFIRTDCIMSHLEMNVAKKKQRAFMTQSWKTS